MIFILSITYSRLKQSILLYASQIWGVYESIELQSIQTFAFKRFFNVSLHSSNTIMYGETGRHPLNINAKFNAIKYWIRIVQMSPSRLVKQAYDMTLVMHNNGHDNWATSIKDILHKNGFGYVWHNYTDIDLKSFLQEFKTRTRDCYAQQWASSLRAKQFSFYEDIKISFRTETYLCSLTFKPYRDALIKFRMAVSPIMCHKYRFYCNKSKLCPLCNLTEENEMHFIFECPLLEDIREKFLPEKCLERRNSQTLAELFKQDRYVFIMGKYIFLGTKKRDSILALKNGYVTT